MSLSKDLRIVLLGKTGEGKSSTGNFILGKEVFSVDFSPVSVTHTCEKHEVKIGDRKISVIDTPGIFNNLMTEEQLKAEMSRCMFLSSPGPHVFLLIIKLGVRFTEEERKAVKWIEENFGEEALKKCTLLIFTGESVDVPTQYSELSDIITDFPHKYFILNERKPSPVSELIEKIEDLVKINSGQYYSDALYQEAQKKMEKERQERMKTEKRNLFLHIKYALIGFFVFMFFFSISAFTVITVCYVIECTMGSSEDRMNICIERTTYIIVSFTIIDVSELMTCCLIERLRLSGEWWK